MRHRTTTTAAAVDAPHGPRPCDVRPWEVKDAGRAPLPVVQSLLCLVRCKMGRILLPNGSYRRRHLRPRVPITQLNFFHSHSAARAERNRSAHAPAVAPPPPRMLQDDGSEVIRFIVRIVGSTNPTLQ